MAPHSFKRDVVQSSVVIDIGATNIRFARLTGRATPGPVIKFATARFSDFASALTHFLEIEGGPEPVRLALAVAGPVHGDRVKLTNLDWQFSIRQLKEELNLKQLAVANDLEAMAMVLPHLTSGETIPIGVPSGRPAPESPMAVLCPGTGMGIAGLVPAGQGWRPIATEGGHTVLAPLTDRETAAWKYIRERYGRVSVERVLSGPGLAELYTALAFLDGKKAGEERPEKIVNMALGGENLLAVETVEMFCALLGDVAGDLALLYLARGGIYLAGDILGSILEILKRSQFRARFENKGRAAGVVDSIPTFLITTESPVLRGCAYLLDSPV
jgi:glucokinase